MIIFTQANWRFTMNFLDAITSHVMWKKNLTTLVNEHNIDNLDDTDIIDDKICGLGVWLQNNKNELSSLEAFENTRASHYLFHESVAEVIQYVKTENHEKAEQLLNGKCSEISHQLQNDIRSMAKEMEDQEF
jgi:hypothetical protein